MGSGVKSFDSEFEALRALSARLGADPLQVQAAGGNTSIKDGDTLWIKASGTWLRDALAGEIMVPVRHGPLRAAIVDGRPEAERAADFVDPAFPQTALRPSIETVVHALMPQPVVVHIHCVDTIAAAVRADGPAFVAERLTGIAHAFVPYARPGLPLAQAILPRLEPGTDVLVLGNHGLVVAGETVGEAAALLDRVRARLAARPRPEMPADEAGLARLAEGSGYHLPADPHCHAVASDAASCRIAARGSLYPDHVVYLGPGSVVADPGEDARSIAERQQAKGLPAPLVVLFPGRGVLVKDGISDGALALARCLSDVTARIPEDAPVHYLSEPENAELLDWDAEKYRQALDRNTDKAVP
jgi:rhamnose utilization protein RhaD (predicted bifunctional aldolase and dehydrogenase)